MRLLKIIPIALLAFAAFTKNVTGLKKNNSLFASPGNDTLKINCDSVYAQKGYFIELIRFEFDKDGFDEEKNSVFTLSKKVDGVKKEILRDTIFSRLQEIKFADYNNDKVDDILIQNIADVRSNLTWYLYFFNPKSSSVTKIKGFEEIKNPKYNSKYNLIENYVLSGTNWTSLYTIKNFRVIDYGFVIYDKDDSKGINRYNSEYKKAIRKIMLRRK